VARMIIQASFWSVPCGSNRLVPGSGAMTCRIEAKKARMIRAQSRQKRIIAVAVATCSPTMYARYGDSAFETSRSVFAYNHLQSYVQSVLYYAAQYAGGNFSVVSAAMPSGSSVAGCAQTTGGVPAVQAPTQAVATAISFAEQQLGKPHLWGGTGPDAFDCSGLMMMAYRTAGIDITGTSQDQCATERRIPASQVQPGDLVFFAGSDGTTTSPGHVGLVIGNGKMIEAYATGTVHTMPTAWMEGVAAEFLVARLLDAGNRAQ